MAIDVKRLLAGALLSLCEQKPLSKITVTDLRQETGISRQTFYNHFKDKQHLIEYIYEAMIISEWKYPSVLNTDFCDALISCLECDVRYRSFLKQALQIKEQNCLQDFMYEHSKKFNRAWHQACYGPDPMPEFLCFASDYHSAAQLYMRIEWILNDLPISVKQLAENIIRLRVVGLNDLFFGENKENSPYIEALKKIEYMD